MNTDCSREEDKLTENLTNVAWKCKKCGEITYHPDADRKGKIEIRTGTLCLKCFRGWGKDGQNST